jgi:hypothetical protein
LLLAFLTLLGCRATLLKLVECDLKLSLRLQ